MIKIKYLCEYPNYLPQIAKLWYNCIGKKWSLNTPLSEIESRFREHLNKDSLPLTYIALDGEKVIGTCSLRSDDGIAKYSPCLGSLCVDQVYRKRGIGKLLARMIKAKAHKMGFQKLYLLTYEQEIANWYSHDGWHEIERCVYKNYPAIVMYSKLS